MARQDGASNYVIKVGRDTITVKVTDGALSVGEQVTVAVRNDRLIITPVQVNVPTPDAEDAAAFDTFTRQGSSQAVVPRESLRAVKAALDDMVAALSEQPVQTKDVQECEALFKTVAPALAPIDKQLTNAIAAALRSIAGPAEDAPLPADELQNAIALIEKLRDKIPTVPANPASGRSVPLQTPVPDGLYRFSTAAEALTFLKPEAASAEAFANGLASRIEENGSVEVRTETREGQVTVATIVTKSETAMELAGLPGRFTSRAFQSIPASVFEQLLDDRGNINIDLLRTLDGFAAELRLPASSTRAGSREAQDAALLQWLTTANDSGAPAGSLSALLPVFSASSIIDSLEEFAQSASQLQGTAPALPAAEDFSMTRDAVAGEGDRSQLLESVMRRMGFTLENTLATTGQPGETSFKQQLLETLNRVQAGTPESAQSSLGKIIQGFLDTVREQLAPQLPDAESSVVRQAIDETLQKGAVAITGLVERLTSEAKAVIAPGQSGIDYQKSITEFADAAGKRIDAQLREIVRDVRLALEPQVKQPSSPAAGASDLPRLDSAPSADVEKELPVLLQKIDAMKPVVARAVESLVRELQRVVQHDRNNPVAERPESANPAAKDDQSLVRQTIRQDLETLLNRFESLQLLARQVQTNPSEQQQILAVPIKVGAEWTEMHVRFVNKQKKKNAGAADGHYTVFLNVAPALLGAIGATMDYTKNKNLNIAMRFEYQATRQWFAANKNELAAKISALGLPSPTITFFMERVNRPAATAGPTATGVAGGVSPAQFDVRA